MYLWSLGLQLPFFRQTTYNVIPGYVAFFVTDKLSGMHMHTIVYSYCSQLLLNWVCLTVPETSSCFTEKSNAPLDNSKIWWALKFLIQKRKYYKNSMTLCHIRLQYLNLYRFKNILLPPVFKNIFSTVSEDHQYNTRSAANNYDDLPRMHFFVQLFYLCCKCLVYII